MSKIVMVSGGFDPIHSGHIYLIREASKHGEVIVLLNSDKWLKIKKGSEFMTFKERKIIIKSIKNVINVISFDDSDSTCINGIKKVLKKYILIILSKNKLLTNIISCLVKPTLL